MNQFLQASSIVVLSFVFAGSTTAQGPLRDQLDQQAGFAPNSQMNEISDNFEREQLREQTRLLRLKNHPVAMTRLLRDSNREEVEKKLEAMRVREGELKERFGPNHPELMGIRHQIDLTERHLQEIVADESVRRPEHEGNRDMKQLESHADAVRRNMAAVQQQLHSTKDDEERQALMQKMQALQKELIFALSGIKSQRKQRHHVAEDDGRMKQVHALHEAAERLETNGLPDVAHELHRRAEALERELARRDEGPEAVIHEMRHDLERLREEMRDMHQKLDRILDLLEAHDSDSDESEDEVSSNSLATPKTTVPV